jgi:hypothetical protein
MSSSQANGLTTVHPIPTKNLLISSSAAPPAASETPKPAVINTKNEEDSIKFSLSDDELDNDEDSNASAHNMNTIASLYNSANSNQIATPSSPLEKSPAVSDSNGADSVNSSNTTSSNLDDTLKNAAEEEIVPKVEKKLELNALSHESKISRMLNSSCEHEEGELPPSTNEDLPSNTNNMNGSDSSIIDADDEEINRILSSSTNENQHLSSMKLSKKRAIDLPEVTKQPAAAQKKPPPSPVQYKKLRMNESPIGNDSARALLKKLDNNNKLINSGKLSEQHMQQQIVVANHASMMADYMDQVANNCNETNGPATTTASSDQIQYSADGRPKLIVSIELDILKLLNNASGLDQLPSVPPQQQQQQTLLYDDLNIKEEAKEPSRKQTDSKSMQSKSNSSTQNSNSSNKESNRPSKKPADSTSSNSNSGKSKVDSSSLNLSKNGGSLKRLSTSVGTHEDDLADQSTKKQKLSTVNSNNSCSKPQNTSTNPVAGNQKTNGSNNRTVSGGSINNNNNNNNSINRASGQNTTGRNSAGPASNNSLNGRQQQTGTPTPARNAKSLDFLHSTIEEQVLHERGVQKKREADFEKDKIKKTQLYMEAVCYFCLCATRQYKLKKAVAASSSTSLTSKTSVELLRDTYDLLKFLNEKLVKSLDSEELNRKFKLLSNWMESFINRSLWLMSYKELGAVREAIKATAAAAAAAAAAASQQQQQQHSQPPAQSHQKPQTSPNEIPPPSPASSVGSNSQPTTQLQSQGISSSQQSNDGHASSTANSTTASSHPQNPQKMVQYYERYFKLTEYNMRSQGFWDANEHQCAEIKYLDGKAHFLSLTFFGQIFPHG